MIFIGIIVFAAWFFLPIVIVVKFCEKFINKMWWIDNMPIVIMLTAVVNLAFIIQVFYWCEH